MTAGQREVAWFPLPVQNQPHVSTHQRTGRADLASPILPGKPHGPASRLAAVIGDAGLSRAGQGARAGAQSRQAPGIEASSRPGSGVGGPWGRRESAWYSP